MSDSPANHGDLDAEGKLPSAAEVVGRLDRLWNSGQASAEITDLHDLAGKSVGPYQLRRIIGRGAFGVVYLAEDEQLGRKVALKLPRPEVLLDEEHLRRFRSEASTAALLDHPLIVPVYSAEFEGPTPYIVSAYCEGPDLGSWLTDQSKPVDFKAATRFVIRLAAAVEYAHQSGVLHRDLKPGNVLLEPLTPEADSLDDYNPQLTDFGLAKLIQESLNDTRSSLMIGTPLYMAPEQLLDDAQQESAATDVYAIGVLLFELLTRQTPREGLGYVEGLDKLRYEVAPSLQMLRPNVPDTLDTITAKCLEREPEKRYLSASSLADDLQRFLDGVPIQAKAVDFKERFSRWTQQPRRLVVAGYFTVWLQAMTVIWISLAGAMMSGYDLLPDGNSQRYFNEIIQITLTGHLPIAWLGWRLAKTKPFSYWPSLVASILQVIVYVYSTVGDSLAFEYVHLSRLSKLNTFSILITCGLLQLAFHLLAFPAWLRLYRERKENTHATTFLESPTHLA